MAGRALWKGIVTFGAVSVPVKLYTMFRDTSTRFNLLHDEDMSRLTMEMRDPVDNVPVHREHQVKGYEIAGGEYVIVHEDELEALQPEGGREIEVKEFVSRNDIDLRYFDTPYYLGPDRSELLYVNLAAALRKTDKVGICQWVMRKKQYLGMLKLFGDVLALVTLHYADEIGDTRQAAPETGMKATPQELSTGEYLVNALSVPFQPEKYRNDYEIQLKSLIEKKARGETVPLRTAAPREATKSEELLDMLKKSVEMATKAKK